MKVTLLCLLFMISGCRTRFASNHVAPEANIKPKCVELVWKCNNAGEALDSQGGVILDESRNPVACGFDRDKKKFNGAYVTSACVNVEK